MIEAIKKLWIDALRSGEFKQGKQCLRNEASQFCCLGVLTELYRREVKPDANWTFIPGVSSGNYAIFGSRLTLAPEVKDWAGLPDTDPCIWDGNSKLLLSSGMNDQGVPFNEIADLIENNELVARLDK